MKKLLLLFAIISSSIITSAQELQGAWKLIQKDGQDVNGQEVIKIYQDGYFAFAAKEAATNSFLKAGGGEFSLEDGYVETYDFHTENKNLVGEEKPYQFQLDNERLTLTDSEGKEEVWLQISSKEDSLSGNWVFTGRQRNGELRRSTPGARRTIKILGGGRFQWVAFNSDTREFHGTGGGTYTAEEGKYTENIEFFSRDDSRVGASLGFGFEVKDGEWHHSGRSSKGDPLYEIWSPYHKAYTEQSR